MINMQKYSKWLSLLFVLSIALNMALLGFIAGEALRTKANKQGRAERIEAVLQVIPEASRGPARDILVKSLPAVNAKMREIRDARAQVIQLMNAEKIDEKAVKDGFERIRTLTNESQALYQNALTEAAATLTPEERRKVVEYLNATRQ